MGFLVLCSGFMLPQNAEHPLQASAVMRALPPALSPSDQRRRLFFWLGVAVLPVFWSWFTLGRRFSRWQRKLAFGWMGLYLVLLACAHEWFVSRGGLLAADPHGVPVAFMWWMVLGVTCWLGRCGIIEVVFVFFVFGPHLGHLFGHQAVGSFLLMAACLLTARGALFCWDNESASDQARTQRSV